MHWDEFEQDYKEELEDGKVLLYTRNGIFQARVYKGNRQYINRSLKTRKLEEARKLAVKFLYEIEFRKQEQLPLQQRTFGDVIREYVQLREQQYTQSQKTTVNTTRRQGTSKYMLYQDLPTSRSGAGLSGRDGQSAGRVLRRSPLARLAPQSGPASHPPPSRPGVLLLGHPAA